MVPDAVVYVDPEDDDVESAATYRTEAVPEAPSLGQSSGYA